MRTLNCIKKVLLCLCPALIFACGLTEMQGYLFYKPMPRDELEVVFDK